VVKEVSTRSRAGSRRESLRDRVYADRRRRWGGKRVGDKEFADFEAQMVEGFREEDIVNEGFIDKRAREFRERSEGAVF
jgi:hypothetical protein